MLLVILENHCSKFLRVREFLLMRHFHSPWKQLRWRSECHTLSGMFPSVSSGESIHEASGSPLRCPNRASSVLTTAASQQGSSASLSPAQVPWPALPWCCPCCGHTPYHCLRGSALLALTCLKLILPTHDCFRLTFPISLVGFSRACNSIYLNTDRVPRNIFTHHSSIVRRTIWDQFFTLFAITK